MCVCFSQKESQTETKFNQLIPCAMGKKLTELVLIDFPLVPPLGFVIPSLFEGFHFLSMPSVLLNSLDKLGVIDIREHSD